jgi:hypothetical protein
MVVSGSSATPHPVSTVAVRAMNSRRWTGFMKLPYRVCLFQCHAAHATVAEAEFILQNPELRVLLRHLGQTGD